MTTTLTTPHTHRSLARHEIRSYATSPLFLIGLLGLTAVTLLSALGEDDGSSSTMNMIVPATLLGLFGMIVMAGQTRRSDRAAAAAGASPAGESRRTLALMAAIVVPLAAALVWFAISLVVLRSSPPADWAVPFGPFGLGDVQVVMFALGVVSAVGGPLLGLLVARWLPGRSWAAVAPVVVVLVTILLQGNFEATWHWRVIWPWTYWYGPLGWSNIESQVSHWVALPGSPWMWLVYLCALCVLGGLVALFHDPESDRARLRRLVVLVGMLALVALALTMFLGLDQAVVNPIPGSSF